jgi:hypothetical protein
MRYRRALVLLALLFAPALVACGGSSSSPHTPGSGSGSTAACTIPQNNGGDHDADNNGGPDDGDGCDR